MPYKNYLSQLLKPNHKALFYDYTALLDLAWKHYSNPEISPEIRIHKVYLLEKAIRCNKLASNKLHTLCQNFITENLSISLLLDLLPLWHCLATNKLPQTETQFSKIISMQASPLARFILALHNESPSAYLPMTTLISALFILQMLYTHSPFLQKVKWSRKQKISKIRGLLINSAVILTIIHSKYLRLKLAILLNIVSHKTEKYAKNQQPNLTLLDEYRIFLYSLYQFATTKHRSVDKRGI